MLAEPSAVTMGTASFLEPLANAVLNTPACWNLPPPPPVQPPLLLGPRLKVATPLHGCLPVRSRSACEGEGERVKTDLAKDQQENIEGVALLPGSRSDQICDVLPFIKIYSKTTSLYRVNHVVVDKNRESISWF